MSQFEEIEDLKIEMIFSDEAQLEEIYENANPVNCVYDILETHYRKTGDIMDKDSNILMAISEFHVNNLIYLKENFNNFPGKVQCKLLNLLSILLHLKEEKTVQRTQGSHEEDQGEGKDEPDFALICRRKLQEVKKGFFQLDLVHNGKSNDGFHLKSNEILALMEYIKTFYLPFIRLYYHFVNIEKITENKRIEFIINSPLPVPALSSAVMQIQDKNLFDEQKEDTNEEAHVDKADAADKKEAAKLEEKTEDKPETYQDLMNKLNLNAETKKIIAEKIEEMYKEVDYKINERQKNLDSKYKEIEDTIKGKKK